jgi:hypothetical protein
MKSESNSSFTGTEGGWRRRAAWICAVLALGAGAAFGDDADADAAEGADRSRARVKKPAPKVQVQPAKQVAVTGSHIKRTAASDGRVDALDLPLQTIDGKQIAQSGATTLSQLLRRRSTAR